MATRADVIAEALSWRGTPFHDRAGVKGAGVDCIHFVIRVYAAVGLIEDFDPPVYSPQWAQHSYRPLILLGLRKYCHRVEVAQPGDIEMYRFGKQAAHATLVVDHYTLIHASKPVGEVLTEPRAAHAEHFHSIWSPDALQ